MVIEAECPHCGAEIRNLREHIQNQGPKMITCDGCKSVLEVVLDIDLTRLEEN